MPTASTLRRTKLTGVTAPARGAVLAELVRSKPGPVWLIVLPEVKLAEQLTEDLPFFAAAAGIKPPPQVLLLPESMPDARDMREAFAASADRMTVLSRLRATRRVSEGAAGQPLVIVTTPAALLQPVPALEDFAAHEITLQRGQTHPFAALLEKLQSIDYDSEVVCETPGSYAVRGGIIDVYPITANEPYRLDFFGDEIEEIRAFDPVTQRSGAHVESITLAASPRLKLDPAKTGLADYLSPASHLVLVEPAAIDEELSRLARDAAPGSGFTPSFASLPARVRSWYALQDLDEASASFGEDSAQEITWDSESLHHHRRYPDDALVAQERLHAEADARLEFLQRAAAWQKEGFTVAFVMPKEGEEQRAKEILAEEPGLKKLRPTFLRGALNEGFRITFRPDARVQGPLAPAAARGLVVITETEVFGRQRPRRPVTGSRALVHRAQVDQLLDFSELVEGDFVVHLQHGIAHYRGLTKLETRDGLREVISLEFDDHVTLHVPLQESHLISRYVGLSKVKPQLGRIGSGRWEKTRKAAERSTVDLAAELLRIQAAREAQPGHAFPSDNAWQQEFEASFPFTETPDQLRAIAETKADHRAGAADGSADLWRRGFRQDRGRHPRRVQGRAGRAPGGGARADHGAGATAPQHVSRAHGGLSDRDRNDQPLPHPPGAGQDSGGHAGRPGGHPDRHAPACCRRTSSSRNSAWSSSTRSSGSA
jgi:transcription-repair coupling factor (superfamily II helicase)